MFQVLAQSNRPALLAPLLRHEPSIRPATDAEAPALGRRLPHFERTARPARAIAAAGPSFLDHLRQAAA